MILIDVSAGGAFFAVLFVGAILLLCIGLTQLSHTAADDDAQRRVEEDDARLER